jgi:hypothetical protein
MADLIARLKMVDRGVASALTNIHFVGVENPSFDHDVQQVEDALQLVVARFRTLVENGKARDELPPEA